MFKRENWFLCRCVRRAADLPFGTKFFPKRNCRIEQTSIREREVRQTVKLEGLIRHESARRQGSPLCFPPMPLLVGAAGWC